MAIETAEDSISYLRIKPYYRLLLRQGEYDFIKTLDEGVRVPAGNFVEVFLQLLLTDNRENALVQQLTERTGVPEASVRTFIDRLTHTGVLERFAPQAEPAFERYHRQLLFFDAIQPKPVFEENFDRQQKLAGAHVAILGIGGIGNYLALSLAASGVGKLSLVDDDCVEISNLSRQILFSDADLGQPKAEAAARRLQQLNPDCQPVPYVTAIDSPISLDALLRQLHPVDYLVLSADRYVELPNWASDLRFRYGFKAIKCGYMGYQGLIGPIFGPATGAYADMFESWAGLIEQQAPVVQNINDRHISATSSASNAILANIACLEILKDLAGTGSVQLLGRRLLFNLKTLEMKWG